MKTKSDFLLLETIKKQLDCVRTESELTFKIIFLTQAELQP